MRPCNYSPEEREGLIEQYVLGQLNEEAVDTFDMHTYDCETCFKALSLREQLVEVVVEAGEAAITDQQASQGDLEEESPDEDPIYKIPRPIPGWLFPAAAAVLVFAIVFIPGIMRPPLDDFARLTESETRSLQLSERSTVEGQKTPFAQAATQLLDAREKKLGLIVEYNPVKVDSAIMNLQQAYQNTADLTTQNRSAYFLAKAHLMNEDEDAAKEWLDKVLASRAVLYQEEARQLLAEFE